MQHPFYFSSTILKAIQHVNHGFFTRKGGVSVGDYESLNCKAAGTLLTQNDGSNIEVKDNGNNVRRNRDIIVTALGGKLWIGLRQKHTNIVHIIDKEFLKNHRDNPPMGDALITSLPHVVLSVITADCVPILLSDTKISLIAAIHAGWKGSLGGIIENTLAIMKTKGATDIVASIGPCIHQENYAVGGEFRDHFDTWILSRKKDDGAKFSDFFKEKGDRFLFNLPKFVLQILKSCGVQHIDQIHQNTYTQEDIFFSYRRNTHEGKSILGCQGSSIMLR